MARRANRNSLAAAMARARAALIFDLDGTLIDSAPDLHRSLNAVLAEQGRAAVELDGIRGMVGDGAAKLVERGFADTGDAVAPAATARPGAALPRPLFRRPPSC